ncbi:MULTISPECIES: hypothetical protein [unclassified Brenneria]|uniref:hypothetical protein n=1 Tax=unclassified Brenneria TaxID=2634434 RepID=UPI0029C2AD5D|nr:MULTISPECIES: hypothetical protein [unclassified Brenneria]MDX5630814.1 hypothetical protein [Brenneria sp. L3-3Z]MDX5697896.1 hypothetical protein [Brenneria sp. L4-2C]
MKITLKDKIDERLVRFKSDIGCGVAIWESDRFSSNTSCDIELEIDDFFEYGKNIALEKKHDCSIDFIDNYMIFKAKIISCEDGGILVLSLGSDIVFIEASGGIEIDGYISFFTTPDKVKLYPIEL